MSIFNCFLTRDFAPRSFQKFGRTPKICITHVIYTLLPSVIECSGIIHHYNIAGIQCTSLISITCRSERGDLIYMVILFYRFLNSALLNHLIEYFISFFFNMVTLNPLQKPL